MYVNMVISAVVVVISVIGIDLVVSSAAAAGIVVRVVSTVIVSRLLA